MALLWLPLSSRYNAGQIYINSVNHLFTTPLELSSLNDSNGFIINGIAAYDGAGYSALRV
ncbi:MAG: hypothetical protein MRQ13_04325 [Candidatus Midichloria sp.]|nr:hypothetical protein [Candidatus Midichloria sp.]